MEIVTAQERDQLVGGIKQNTQKVLSQIPEDEKVGGSVIVEIEPVVPDHDNLIATADIINIRTNADGDVDFIRSQTSDSNAGIEFVRGIFLNAPGGPWILESDKAATQQRIDPDAKEEEIFKALANGRHASKSELSQLDILMARAQKGFRVFKSPKT